MKLKDWIENWKAQYSERELGYMDVQKALIQLQLKDEETQEIHIRSSEYTDKKAANLIMAGGDTSEKSMR